MTEQEKLLSLLPKLPDDKDLNDKGNQVKIGAYIEYVNKLLPYLEKIQEYINKVEKAKDILLTEEKREAEAAQEAAKEAAKRAAEEAAKRAAEEAGQGEGEAGQNGGKGKNKKRAMKKGGADIDYNKVYNVQGLLTDLSKSSDAPVSGQSMPAPFSSSNPLQRLSKKEGRSLPSELKNEIIPDYVQDGGKKKRVSRKKKGGEGEEMMPEMSSQPQMEGGKKKKKNGKYKAYILRGTII